MTQHLSEESSKHLYYSRIYRERDEINDGEKTRTTEAKGGGEREFVVFEHKKCRRTFAARFRGTRVCCFCCCCLRVASWTFSKMQFFFSEVPLASSFSRRPKTLTTSRLSYPLHLSLSVSLVLIIIILILKKPVKSF